MGRRKFEPIDEIIQRYGEFKVDLNARFWPKIDQSTNRRCWPWTAATNEHGYGKFSFRIRRMKYDLKAHRLAWAIANLSEISEFECIRHACDNPACCNPMHLIAGTMQQNTNDMISRGRFKPPPVLFGQENYNVKISYDEVLAMRSMEGTHAHVARVFNMNPAAVSAIRRGLRRVTK
jgi:hypothetical protein